jgi:hypothetical protein
LEAPARAPRNPGSVQSCALLLMPIPSVLTVFLPPALSLSLIRNSHSPHSYSHRLPGLVMPPRLPVEIWDVIVRQACLEDVSMACGLRRLSRKLREAVEPSRFLNLAVDGYQNMRLLHEQLKLVSLSNRPRTINFTSRRAYTVRTQSTLVDRFPAFKRTRERLKLMLSKDKIATSLVEAMRDICTLSAPSVITISIAIPSQSCLARQWLLPTSYSLSSLASLLSTHATPAVYLSSSTNVLPPSTSSRFHFLSRGTILVPSSTPAGLT